MKHTTKKIEFGDFQTPLSLADECCKVVKRLCRHPMTIVEPTCGKGAFVVAAAQRFNKAKVVGFEINDSYRRAARKVIRQTLSSDPDDLPIIKKQDFFSADWDAWRLGVDGSVLFLGNPPWVTNSQLGVLNSDNVPSKSNVENLSGLDAMTGRSNFDISESMLQSLLAVMQPDRDWLAMLVKTATARKILRGHWKSGNSFSHASIHAVDAKKHFDVNVDACLLILAPTRSTTTQVCLSSPTLGEPADCVAMGWHDGQLVSDPSLAAKTDFLCVDTDNAPTELQWRSGIKHDLSRVLELSLINGKVTRQDGSVINVESEVLFPLAKGADVANNRTECESRRMLITQRSLGESTSAMKQSWPKAYRYLKKHRSDFDARKSSIYRGRDPYALFGIGPYTFQPWKIAICGLYKRLQFTLLGPIDGRAVVTDDTCYSLSFETQREAKKILRLLRSPLATDFFNARIFWDAKRPITAEVLRQLDVDKLAKEIAVI